MSWFSASPPSQRWVCVTTVLLTAAAVPTHAQTAPKRDVKTDDQNAPTVVQAEEIGGRPEREITLQGNVEVSRGATRLQADTACYRQVEDEVEANGHIRMSRLGDVYTGEELKMNLETGQGFVLKPTYRMAINNGQGKADRVDFLNQEVAVVKNGTYSTCEGSNPDWYLRTSTLSLDSGRDVGTGRNAIVYFKDVPILGTPAMTFSLSGARRSGWLSPIPGFGSKGGAELTVPYYFNIAPNRDLTLFPKQMPKRGLQIGANGRYIGETGAGSYAGETYAEFLLDDKQSHTDRWMIKSSHTQALANGWSAGWNLNGASDNEYPSDFSKTVASAAERQLLRELRTDYQGEFWSLTARVQNYQVLQDPAAMFDPNNPTAVADPSLFVSRPYDRLPSINFNAGQFDVGGFDWAVDAELTRFWHPDLVRGNRLVAVPQLSYPIIRPGYFITPKLMVNASTYQIDNDENSRTLFPQASLSRAIPTVSVDSGMVFERGTTLFGPGMTQTLEPRLFYVYTPYHQQSEYPNFDTALATFNFAQLFSENRFVGSDRIGDANQVTAALTSRFLEANGAERLRLAFGQRFYFTNQRVQLDASTPLKETRSDILLAANGRISDTWSFDSAVQYGTEERQVTTSNYGVQWQPGAKKVINLSYRYQRDTFQNTEVSAQWPLSARWYGVGRLNYSTRDRRILESLVGLEYNGDCWVFRMGAQRFVTTANNVSTPIFFQLELNGLSKLGVGNPLETLKSSIPGYQRLNPTASR